MTDHNLRDIASRCEAKLHGFRRTADGVVVSFVLHPAEVPPALALDPLGTRYMLAFVAIGDDEQPIPADGGSVGASDVAPDRGINRGNPIPASPHDAGERPLSVTLPEDLRLRDCEKYRKRFAGRCNGCAPGRPCWPDERQGVIHPPCEDTTGASLGHSHNPLTPKARYAAMTAGEHARGRAGRLPREDERFRAWAAIERHGADALGYALSEDDAAQFIRDRCCGGKSRRLIAEDPEAMDKFIALETAFKIAVGEIAEPR